jgi:serine/threonine protein kinase
MVLTNVIKEIEEAHTFKDLCLGQDPAKTFTDLAKIVHPDKYKDEETKTKATVAMQRLSELYAVFTKKIDSSSIPIIAGYAITDSLYRGDICDLYKASSKEHEIALLKIARTSAENDLLQAESLSLKQLTKAKADTKLSTLHYLPNPYTSAKASSRSFNILSYEENFLSLEEIIHHFPARLDFRHCVWMMNRLLSALGIVHRSGIVHGAIIPSHLLYGPSEKGIISHDLRLIDWCYSVKIGDHIKALSSKYKGLYPPEVTRKWKAHISTDIFMSAKCVEFVASNIPKRFKALLEWCMASSPASRPDDAWKVQDRWINLAKEEYGDPRYVELKVKVN